MHEWLCDCAGFKGTRSSHQLPTIVPKATGSYGLLWLFLTAGVVIRIDVIELQWRSAVDLDHNFAAGHCIVMHVGIQISETARGKISHLGFIKAISHPDFESSRDDRDV